MSLSSNENSSTLLIYNRDYHQQSPVKYRDCFNKAPQELYDIFCSKRYRMNTGTFLMTDTLAKLLDAKWIYPYDFDAMKNSNVTALVTNAFHCISPKYVFDKDYWQRILDTGIKIVPMTCGFRYHEKGDIYLTEDMVYILTQIAERNEIGVRGEKSAEILNSYGIKNVRIVGCHSLFYHNIRDYQIKKKDRKIKKINFNFNQCYQDFFQSHLDFCRSSAVFFEYIYRYFKSHAYEIHYSMQTSFMKEWMGYNNFTHYEYVKEFPLKTGTYYFSVDDWIEGIRSCDFSLGTQFHGSVAAILSGVPALIFNIDDRMKELCQVHNIPNIDIEDFDKNKTLEYYFDKTDYTEFNKNYGALYDNFLEYCSKNEIKLRYPVTEHTKSS